ncbi:unnamed protein product, partial [Choristocarpus tenellus]
RQGERRVDFPTIEFYSGIGGLRVALEESCAPTDRIAKVVESYEINTVANSVYYHNFPGKPVRCRSIEHLSAEDLDGVAKLWMLR